MVGIHYRTNNHPTMAQGKRAAHGATMRKTLDIPSTLAKYTRSLALAVDTPLLLPMAVAPTPTTKYDRGKEMKVGQRTCYGLGSQGWRGCQAGEGVKVDSEAKAGEIGGAAEHGASEVDPVTR